MKEIITEKSTLKEVLDHEGLEEVLMESGFPCVSCPMMKMEMDQLEIGFVCDKYEIDKVQLIKKLNESLRD
jgi:hypothetical protein